MATPLTGDIKDRIEVQKKGVTFHNFPQVLASALVLETDNVNSAKVSGKRLGAQVLGTTLTDGVVTGATIYAAAGKDVNDPWVPVKTLLGADATDNIVPAA